MNDCESECFWSSDTATQVVSGFLIGAIIGAFIGCLVDGTLAFVDGGFTCAANLIADLLGWWLVAGMIGAVIAALLAYAECQAHCATAVDAADTEAGQGLVEDEGGEDPKDCDTVRRWVELVRKAKTKTDRRLGEAKLTLQNSRRQVLRARTFKVLAYGVASIGLFTKAWMVLGALVVLVPIATVNESRKKRTAIQALRAASNLQTLASLYAWRVARLQELIPTLCK
jgi:hypothetical protein